MKKYYKYLFGYVILILLTAGISFIPIINSTISLKVLGVLSVIELCVFLGINKKFVGSFINFSTLFVFVLYVFNFGQLVILTFFRGVYSHVRFLNLMMPKEALYAFRFINLAFGAICIGILISESSKCLTCRKYEEKTFLSLEEWGRIAKFIITLTFPVKVVLDVVVLYITVTQGGTASRAWLNAFPNVILYYGKISMVGFALLLVSLQSFRKAQTRVFIAVETYLLMAMLNGIRSENVSYICVMALLYFMCSDRKFKIRHLLLLGVTGILGLTFIVTAGGFRNAADKSVASFFEMFMYYLIEKNIVFYLLDTCGDTAYTAICVLTKWLKHYEPSWGTAYYLGWTAIVPSLFGITGKWTAESYFALKLQEHDTLYWRYKNIGGSLIGEQFFNFQITGGIVACLVIGLLIGWISKKSYEEIKNGKIIVFPYITASMFCSLYWIRDYFGGGIREVVWGAVFCWIIMKIYVKADRKRKGDICKKQTSVLR